MFKYSSKPWDRFDLNTYLQDMFSAMGVYRIEFRYGKAQNL